MAMQSRPLVRFREGVRACLAEDILPTPQVMAERGYDYRDKKYPRSFQAGYLTLAREEEMLDAGWRRMAYKVGGSNYRWVKITRKADTLDSGKRVRTKFRVGDKIQVYSAEHAHLHGKVLDVVSYDEENGYGVWVATGAKDKKKNEFLQDAQMILAEANEQFPLK
jgi:hypothetical protein